LDDKISVFESKRTLTWSDYENYADDANKKMKWKGGHTWQVDFTDGVMTRVDENGNKSEWNPAQVHIHTPSEHTVEGNHHDAEIHFVHTSPESGAYAVLGVFFDEVADADDNPYLATWINDATNQLKNQAAGKTVDMQVKTFMQTLKEKDFWAYDGSLTTPPCTEGLKWHVMKKAQEMSPAQHALIKNLKNARDVQPLNDRTLSYSFNTATAFSMTAAVFTAFAALMQ